ncbi:MAG: hypothetical protein ABEJ30_06600 [Halorientalis sp.]
MGTTPDQQSRDGGDAPGDGPAPGLSVLERVAAAVRGLAAAARRRLSVFPDLDFGGAFELDSESEHPRRPPERRGDGAGTRRALPRADDAPLPPRERPFTVPGEEEDSNQPDLEATEEDGRLSLSYPGHEGAELSSDTYRQVER